MLGFLFRGLTAEPARGAPLFDAVTALARRPSWFVEGQVQDTLDGRFALLSTIAALVVVRAEREGPNGNRVSVELTERFIEVMESEHRELGLGDPTLGRTVRKLVGLLAKRTELWRNAIAGESDWNESTRKSLYKEDVAPDALRYSGEELHRLWSGLSKAMLIDLERGTLG